MKMKTTLTSATLVGAMLTVGAWAGEPMDIDDDEFVVSHIDWLITTQESGGMTVRDCILLGMLGAPLPEECEDIFPPGPPSDPPGPPGPDPISAEMLTERAAFAGDVSIEFNQDLEGLPEQSITRDDASHLLMARFTIQPGAAFPWHTHPGTVLINVIQGEFVFVFAEDCVHREFAPGDALVDPGDVVHTAYNPAGNDEPTQVVVTFIGAPAEGPLTIPVDEETNDQLDVDCGIERGG